MAALGWAASSVLFLFFAFIQSSASKAINETHGSGVTVDDINNVLGAIDKLLKYFKNTAETLNLDGFFGLRVLEGHLHLLIQEHKSGNFKALPHSIFERIEALSREATSVSEFGIDFVRKDDSRYFEDFSPVVGKPWAVFKRPRKLDPSLRWEIPQYKAKLKVHMTETLSDKCLKQVMNATNSSSCFITEECAKIMTTRGLTGYDITHQLLWSIIGEMSLSCSLPIQDILKKHSMADMKMFQLELCTNNFYEMIAIVHVLMKGNVDPSQQDLFLEQQFVCPSVGFFEFLKKDYLQQILSWQFPEGCFGDLVEDSEDEDEIKSKIDFGQVLETYHQYKELKTERKSPADKSAFFPPKNNNGKLDKYLKNVDMLLRTNTRPSFKPADHVKLSSLIEPAFQRNHPNLEKPIMESPMYKKTNSINKHLSHIKALKVSPEKLPLNLNADSLNQGHIPKKEPNVEHFAVKGNKVNPLNSQKLNYRHKEDSVIDKNQQKIAMRSLLAEKRLGGGCLSHKTGVAAGSLVIYLRYLIEPGEIKWTGHHDLFLSDTRNLLEVGNQNVHFKDMQSVDAAIADYRQGKQEEEEEEEEEDALDELEEEDEEGEDIEDEDDETAANYNDDEGWEVATDWPKRGDHGEDDDEDKDEEILINENGQQREVDYANLDNQEVGLKNDPPPKNGQKEEEEGHYYYEDEYESEKSIIKKRHPITVRPFPPSRVRRKHKRNEDVMYSQVNEEVLIISSPNTSLLVLISITPVLLIMLFLIKCVRRRRIHLRYLFCR